MVKRRWLESDRERAFLRDAGSIERVGYTARTSTVRMIDKMSQSHLSLFARFPNRKPSHASLFFAGNKISRGLTDWTESTPVVRRAGRAGRDSNNRPFSAAQTSLLAENHEKEKFFELMHQKQ